VYDAHLFAVALPQGENLLAAVVSLGGIFAGFLATIKTLLLGANEKTLDRLRKSGYIAEWRTSVLSRRFVSNHPHRDGPLDSEVTR
jgi:hypothetical protein